MEKILIYDDIHENAEELKKLLTETESFDIIHIADTYDMASEFLNNNEYTIIFMDIELDGGRNGINLSGKLQDKGCMADLVYITGYTNYYEKIFSTKPVAFIQKPFKAASVRYAIDVIKKKRREKSFIIIDVSRNHSEKIMLDNILYIEHANRYLEFFSTEGDMVYQFYDRKISEIENQLPDNFIRCHQSFVVNMDFVSEIQRFKFTLTGISGQFFVPVGQLRFKETRKKYIDYISRRV